MKPTYRFPPAMKQALDETGLSFSLEQRKRHIMLIVDGQRLCVLSRGSHECNKRLDRNSAAAIYRLAKTRNARGC